MRRSRPNRRCRSRSLAPSKRLSGERATTFVCGIRSSRWRSSRGPSRAAGDKGRIDAGTLATAIARAGFVVPFTECLRRRRDTVEKQLALCQGDGFLDAFQLWVLNAARTLLAADESHEVLADLETYVRRANHLPMPVLIDKRTGHVTAPPDLADTPRSPG